MYHHLWHIIIRFLHLLRVTLSTPYVWDAKRDKFVLITSPMYLKWNHMVSYVIYGNTVVMAWNVIQAFQKEAQPLYLIISWGIGAMSFVATVNRWMHHKGASSIVQFLNCMVGFQRSGTERGNKRFT
jgi:hypothetical protein